MILDRIAPYLPIYPYVMAVWMALSSVLLLAGLYNIRRRRTAQVWRNRHRADQRGRHLLLWSVSSLTASALISAISLSVIFAFGYVEEFFPPRNPYGVTGIALTALATEDPNQTVTATPTRTPSRTVMPITPTKTPTETVTLTPSETLTPSQTSPPTLTPTPSETVTPRPTQKPLARLGITPPFSPFKVPEFANMQVVAADDTTTETGTPDSPQTTFTTDTETIYFFVTYRNMRDDLVWSWVVFRNGIPVSGDAVLWRRGSDGAMFFPLEAARGFPIGDYDMRLYLNDSPMDTFSFTIDVPDDRPNSP